MEIGESSLDMDEMAGFPNFLNLRCDEDGYYLVDDNQTIVYGDGETPMKAFHNYILSLIEYSQLLLPKTAMSLAECETLYGEAYFEAMELERDQKNV